MRGAVMGRVHEAQLTVKRGQEALSRYQWNTYRAEHFFCRVCGIYVFHRKRSMPDHFGLNVQCLPDFDLADKPVRKTDGAHMSVVRADAPRHWTGPRETDR